MSIRLNKALRELNIGLQTAVEFLSKRSDPKIRASAQGLFMLMTNGLGATIGTLWVIGNER